MIKDFLVSFKDNIKQKTSNPLFGTLIIVWIIHNWEFVYSIFNFERNTKLPEKIEFLKLYLDGKPFLINMGICILITFIALIIFYSLLNISRLITNFYEKIVTPWVYKLTDKTSIVLKSKYDLLKIKNEDLTIKYEKERESKVKLQAEIERLESKIDKDILENTVVGSPEDIVTHTSNSDNIELQRVIDIEKRGWISDFEELLLQIKNGKWISNTEMIIYLLKTDVIQATARRTAVSQYAFTDEGKKIKKAFVDNYLLKNGSA